MTWRRVHPVNVQYRKAETSTPQTIHQDAVAATGLATYPLSDEPQRDHPAPDLLIAAVYAACRHQLALVSMPFQAATKFRAAKAVSAAVRPGL